jgi:hypothetical protein
MVVPCVRIIHLAARSANQQLPNSFTQHSTCRRLLRAEKKNPLSPSSPPRLPSQGKRNWNLFTEATVSSLFQFPSKIDGLVFLLSSQLRSPWGHLAAVSTHSKAGWQRNCTFLKQSSLNPCKIGDPVGGILFQIQKVVHLTAVTKVYCGLLQTQKKCWWLHLLYPTVTAEWLQTRFIWEGPKLESRLVYRISWNDFTEFSLVSQHEETIR